MTTGDIFEVGLLLLFFENQQQSNDNSDKIYLVSINCLHPDKQAKLLR